MIPYYIAPNGYLYAEERRLEAMCPVDNQGAATATFYWDKYGRINFVTVMSVFGPKLFEKALKPGLQLDRSNSLVTLEQICADVQTGSIVILSTELLAWIKRSGNHKSFLEKWLDPLCEAIWRLSLLTPWAKKA